MIKVMKRRLSVIGLLLTLGLGLSQPLFAKEKWQEGTATIGANNNQKVCPVGSSSTARAPGCKHDDCTKAKNQAKANLRGQFPDCGKYIHATGTCLNGPCC